MRTLTLSLLLIPLAVLGDPSRTIQVGATAEQGFEPNLVEFGLEIWSVAPHAKEAQSLNARETERVRQALLARFKIAAKEIRTQSYDLNPQYDYQKQPPRVRGMRVSHRLQFQTSQLEQVGAIFDTLSSESSQSNVGVSFQGLRWQTSERAKLELELIDRAVKQARLRAEALAKAAGVSLGSVRTLTHQIQAHSLSMPTLKMAARMESDSSTNVQPGQVQLSAEVSVVYEIQ